MLFTIVVAVLACLAQTCISMSVVPMRESELLRRASRQIGWNSRLLQQQQQQQQQNTFNSNEVVSAWGKEDGGFIFEDEYEQMRRTANFQRRPSIGSTTTQSSAVAVPGMGTRRTFCENLCLTTPEYNPVCGSDGMSYFSLSKLRCAQKCGKRVSMKHLGACSTRST